MDWSQVTSLTIPEGNVEQVSVNGVVLWRKSLLPSGYTQLEYIESTGTQYIDTGILHEDLIVEYEALTTKASSESQIFLATSLSTNWVGWKNGNPICNTVINVDATQRRKYKATYTHSRITLMDIETGLTGITSNGSLSDTLHLFSWEGGLYSSYTKLYSCKMFEGTTLLANLIPAMRNSDSKVGMYDTVTRQFFTNAGTGEFIASPRFVEYIEFDGNSLIDTGFTQQTCRVEFGVEFINHNNAVQLLGFHVSNAGFWGIKFKGAMFYPYLKVNPYQYNDVILNLDATNTKKPALTLTIGDATSSPVVGSVVNPKTTYVMGGVKSGSNIAYNNFMKVYYNRIYNANNELIQDLRPCLHGNTPCMYDMVTETYFYNQGTGEFIAGGEV